MANSKYEYVRLYEHEDKLLPETYIVVRVDGRKFHQLSKKYNFAKPNDLAALSVMNKAAEGVMRDVQDIFLAYGDSDEYSFVFMRDTNLFERRSAKLVSTVVSTFTAHYVCSWPTFFPDNPLLPSHLPSFDGRSVLYPNFRVLRDYFAWRQVDCHINNLYNTTFWALVLKGGLTPDEAETKLQRSLSADKNEILFSEFGINYNNEPEIYKKGSILRWEKPLTPLPPSLSKRQKERRSKTLGRTAIQVLHCDIIRDDAFWGHLQALNETDAAS